MANPFFSGRIPNDLYKKALEHITETGKTKTEILIEALAAYLNHPIAVPPKVEKTDASEINEKFKALEERINKLEKSLKPFDDNVIKVDNIVKDQSDNKIDEAVIGIVEVDNQLSLKEKVEKSNLDNNLDTFDNNTVIDDNCIVIDDNKKRVLRTSEIPSLPGFNKENRSQILNKLRNARGKSEVKINQYLFRKIGKEEGSKGSILWEYFDIITTTD